MEVARCCVRLSAVGTAVPPRKYPWPNQVRQLLSASGAAAADAGQACSQGMKALGEWEDDLAAGKPGSVALQKVTAAVGSFANLDVKYYNELQTLANNLRGCRGEGCSVAAALAGLVFALQMGTSMYAALDSHGNNDEDQQLRLLLNQGLSASALLAKYFCASAATVFQDHRLLSTAAHTMSLPHVQDGQSSSFMQVFRLAAEFFAVASADSHEPRLVGLQVSLPAPRVTLIINVGPSVPLSRLRASATIIKNIMKDGTQDIGDLDTAVTTRKCDIHVLWLESFYVRHTPRLVNLFANYPCVEVLCQPFFNLYDRDAQVWQAMPTLPHLHCSQVPCYVFDLPNVAAVAEVATDSRSSAQVDDRPQEPGCWVRLPSTCQASGLSTESLTGWQRDVNGENYFGARTESEACLELRRDMYDQWCEATGTEMHYVAPRPVDDHLPDRRSEASATASRADAAANALLRDVFAELKKPMPISMPEHGFTNFAGCEGCQRYSPPNGHLQSAGLWRAYLERHARAVRRASMWDKRQGACGLESRDRCIVWACHPEFPCGGHGDRLKGIVAVFIFALLTDRLFFIDCPDPWDIRLFLEPKLLDWRAVGLRGVPGGRHVLWDHDAFEAAELDRLLKADEPLWVVYTNKKSFLGPLLRHPRFASRVRELQLLEMPHLTYHIWHILFRPTAALEQRWQRLEPELSGGSGYVAMHHRAGDFENFGIVNGEIDRRSGTNEVIALLACAHKVEKDLGLPVNATRWYLASDGRSALQIPQVEVWRKAGKLMVSWPTAEKVHIATEGVLPPSQSTAASESRNNSVYAAAASLAGVADAWLDFLILSRASVLVVSSSSFGLTAAQVGGLDYTYSSTGCVRMDLLV